LAPVTTAIRDAAGGTAVGMRLLLGAVGAGPGQHMRERWAGWRPVRGVPAVTASPVRRAGAPAPLRCIGAPEARRASPAGSSARLSGPRPGPPQRLRTRSRFNAGRPVPTPPPRTAGGLRHRPSAAPADSFEEVTPFEERLAALRPAG